MKEYKQVPIKTLKKGDKFSHLITPRSARYADFEIIEINGAFVKLLTFGKFEETISTEDCFVDVPLTDEEYHAKYETEAKKIVELMRKPVSSYSQGYHEMDNSWIEVDAYDFAATCKRKNISLIGWFPLPEPIDMPSGLIMDIGIIGQDNHPHDHDTYWCHASKSWVDSMIREWDKQHGVTMKEIYVSLTYLDTIEVPEDTTDEDIDKYIKDNIMKSLPIGNINDIEWQEAK